MPLFLLISIPWWTFKSWDVYTLMKCFTICHHVSLCVTLTKSCCFLWPGFANPWCFDSYDVFFSQRWNLQSWLNCLIIFCKPDQFTISNYAGKSYIFWRPLCNLLQVNSIYAQSCKMSTFLHRAKNQNKFYATNLGLQLYRIDIKTTSGEQILNIPSHIATVWSNWNGIK